LHIFEGRAASRHFCGRRTGHVVLQIFCNPLSVSGSITREEILSLLAACHDALPNRSVDTPGETFHRQTQVLSIAQTADLLSGEVIEFDLLFPVVQRHRFLNP
jgi:hypothetical protein